MAIDIKQIFLSKNEIVMIIIVSGLNSWDDCCVEGMKIQAEKNTPDVLPHSKLQKLQIFAPLPTMPETPSYKNN